MRKRKDVGKDSKRNLIDELKYSIQAIRKWRKGKRVLRQIEMKAEYHSSASRRNPYPFS